METLARAIDTFVEYYDPYGYGDAIENKEQAVLELKTDLESGNVDHIILYLADILEDDDEGVVTTVKSLLHSLIRIKEGFKNDN